MKRIIIILVLILVSGAAGFFWTKSRAEKVLSGSVGNENPTPSIVQSPVPNYPKTIGDFLVTDKEICKENDKPIVYFFGSSGCPHCVWEKPIVQKVFNQFKNEISYHENFDSQDDNEVFQKYADINPGYVPFFILGCKYARVGAGENLGKDDAESKKLEEEALGAIVCKLTGGKPKSVCDPLRAKTSEIR